MNLRYIGFRPTVLPESVGQISCLIKPLEHNTMVTVHRRVNTVPLPLTSAVQLDIHPLLRHRIPPSIIYNLNYQPGSATLSNTDFSSQREYWHSQPALIPNDADSCTIMIEGVERPIVIVAATNLDLNGPCAGFISIWDILYHCHLAWNQAMHDFRRTDSDGRRASYTTLPSTGSLLFSQDAKGEGSSVHVKDHAVIEHMLTTERGPTTDHTVDVANLMMADNFSKGHCFWAGLAPLNGDDDGVWIVKLLAG